MTKLSCKEQDGVQLPAAPPHCWHEVSRDTFRSLGTGPGAYGTMTKIEKCCQCGKGQVKHLHLEQDKTHGPFANPVWTLDT